MKTPGTDRNCLGHERSLASKVYLYRLVSAGGVLTRKLTMLK